MLTRIDSHKSVGLIDCLYKDQEAAKHLEFTIRMNESPQEQFMYTEKLMEIHLEEAKEAITEYSISQTNAQQAQDWLKILNINLELAC